MSRMKIEALMKGKKLPFDDQVLEYLLKVHAQMGVWCLRVCLSACFEAQRKATLGSPYL